MQSIHHPGRLVISPTSLSLLHLEKINGWREFASLVAENDSQVQPLIGAPA